MSRVNEHARDFSGLNGLKAALVPFIQLDFEGFSTGCIPPKYISSFSASRVRDMTGSYELSLIYAPDTFTKGDDLLGIKLAQCMRKLGGEVNSDAKELQVNAKLTYGWVGGIKISFKQAVVSQFYESLDQGVVTYQIKGVLGPAVINSMKTSLDKESFYDINNDDELTYMDYILLNENAFNDDMWSDADDAISNEFTKVYGGTEINLDKATIIGKIAANKVPAGMRLSDVIEILADYIFRNVYTVIVEHSDKVYDEDTDFTAIMTNGYEVTTGESLINKLKKLVNICYSTYSLTFTGKTGTAFEGRVISIEQDTQIDETEAIHSLYYRDDIQGNKLNIGDLYDSGYELGLGRETERVAAAKKLFDISSHGSLQYQMIYVDNKYTNGLPIIKIGTDASIYSGSQLGHYVVSNNSKNNTVTSCSFSSNLIPLVSAFGQTLSKSDKVDIENGEIVSLIAPSLPASLSREKMSEYAEQLALKLEDHINNINDAELSVIFDVNSTVFGIDDTLHITNKINGGNTLYDGLYYIKEMGDSLDGGLLITNYKLLYSESQVHEYMTNYIYKLLEDLNPDTKIT